MHAKLLYKDSSALSRAFFIQVYESIRTGNIDTAEMSFPNLKRKHQKIQLVTNLVSCLVDN